MTPCANRPTASACRKFKNLQTRKLKPFALLRVFLYLSPATGSSVAYHTEIFAQLQFYPCLIRCLAKGQAVFI
jgi:hypothetical protein